MNNLYSLPTRYPFDEWDAADINDLALEMRQAIGTAIDTLLIPAPSFAPVGFFGFAIGEVLEDVND